MKHKTYNIEHQRTNIKRMFQVSGFRFHEKGFSLLELIIYVAILSTVSAVFIAILIQLNFGWTRSKVESEVQQNMRRVIESVSHGARSASKITYPSAGGSDNILQLEIDGQTVQYATTSAGVLQKQTGANPPENITTESVKVTYLRFSTIQNTAISNSAVAATSTQINLTIEYNTDNAQFRYSQSATTTAKVRN